MKNIILMNGFTNFLRMRKNIFRLQILHTLNVKIFLDLNEF